MLTRSIRGNPTLALAAVGLATFMTSLDSSRAALQRQPTLARRPG